MTTETNPLEELISKIRLRYEEIKVHESKKERFLLHLRSLGMWEKDEMDYEPVKPDFPDMVDISFAVCHPHCGKREFIVEGSTQECQRCGGLMFRVATEVYRKS